jgi:hypothetical protein
MESIQDSYLLSGFFQDKNDDECMSADLNSQGKYSFKFFLKKSFVILQKHKLYSFSLNNL